MRKPYTLAEFARDWMRPTPGYSSRPTTLPPPREPEVMRMVAELVRERLGVGALPKEGGDDAET